MLAGLGAAVVTMLACCVAVLLVARVGPEWGSGPSLANELLDSGAGGEPLERAERARGSQLADLFDSPLVLAKQKIDGVLREDMEICRDHGVHCIDRPILCMGGPGLA